ncbi:unnamed protein product, partial [Allacma fusca]
EKELKFSVEPPEKEESDPETPPSNVKIPARKLPKSESFSHNSEFDVVKMKRRVFSKEGKMNAVVKKQTQAYDSSSSDEDLSENNST